MVGASVVQNCAWSRRQWVVRRRSAGGRSVLLDMLDSNSDGRAEGCPIDSIVFSRTLLRSVKGSNGNTMRIDGVTSAPVSRWAVAVQSSVSE